MTFISYAQNFEDVMLWRAFRHQASGFYIDVGAFDATAHSVTRAFYERGWHGINIEPLQQRHQQISFARDRDVNLNIAVGEDAGERIFYEVTDTGLSTLAADIAKKHQDNGWSVVDRTVETQTLAQVCETHASTDIHFLKIDVEGAERAVLAGADFERFRPWIVLVEAVEPLRPVPNHHEWEPLLRAARYAFVWFDGLNRFYVACERLHELASCFTVQPNVFDDFVVYRPPEPGLQTDNTGVSELSRAERTIAALYRSLLLREADAEQLRSLSERLANEGDLEAIVAHLLTAPEFSETSAAFRLRYGIP